jgi:hypothetical protein
MALLGRLLFAAALWGTVASTLGTYPHQLAYFNELAGGSERGADHLLHSNLDWGQDLFLLKEWIDSTRHPALVLLTDVMYEPAHLGITDGDAPADSCPCAVTLTEYLGAEWESRPMRSRGVMRPTATAKDQAFFGEFEPSLPPSVRLLSTQGRPSRTDD